MEITSKVIGPDPHIALLLGHGELIGSGAVDPVELPTIWQREIDGDPGARGPFGLPLGLV
jgi:hypothetical protein